MTMVYSIRSIAFLACLLTAAAVCSAAAQEALPALPPGVSPSQIEELLRTRPELRELLRRRVQESGLTAEDVRDRLEAEGYPSDMLDAYLGESPVPAPALGTGGSLVEALSLLGITAYSRPGQVDTLGLRLSADSLLADSLAREARAAGGLNLFGLDVFRQPTTRFQPLVTGPVDDSYVLGPGDVLVLILTGAVQQAHILEVTRGGFVVIPDAGQVHVNTLTLGQLREVLYDRLARVHSGISRRLDARTKFDLAVAKVRVQQIRVAGEVARPGTYEVAATGTVLTAIYEAGGPTERGNFRAVEVRRGSALVATVDLYDYLLRGVVPTEAVLAAGDVVFVPVRGPRVTIAGEVTRPAIYEIMSGETLRDLIEIAGGLTPQAAAEVATIERVIPPLERTEPARTRTVLTVDLAAVLRGEETGPALSAGDSVTVFSIRGGRRDAVTIRGSVWQPGTYHLESGMRLSDLLEVAGGVRPEAYAGRAQILRTFPDSTRQLMGVTLGREGGGIEEDPLLRELDEVTVFAETDFRPRRFVSVDGAVLRPGRVAFADSVTLRDAILLAGGLREDAYLAEAEVSRMRLGAAPEDTLAVILKVPLDSSYVVDGTSYLAREPGDRSAPVVVLHPYDNVFIRVQPGWSRLGTVALTGEVRFPGRYALTRRDERLLSVLDRAGGFTRNAYPAAVGFYRLGGGPVPSPEAAAISDFTAPARQVPLWRHEARIAVDLLEVLEDSSHADNLVLVAGDSIHIPGYIPFVRVEGAVNAPGIVPYRPRWKVDDYVKGAGGFAAQADEGRTFVQQPNGMIGRGGTPLPGSVVIVPQEDPREGGVPLLAILAASAPLVASLATIIVVLTQ
jgi:protein involved in polysaccharide export with SLBB domain